ncbi:Slp family lipoprotein [Gracilibacillus sp. Marseille-QA3620]
MDTLLVLLLLVALVVLFVYIIKGFIAVFKKNGTAKQHFKKAGISFGVIFLIFIIIGFTQPSTEKELTAEEKAQVEAKAEEAAKEKAEEEAAAKKKAEEEKKAKEEAERKAAEKKANAKPIEYAQLKKNPDRYEGEYVKYYGQIVQIIEDDDYTNIRLAVTKDEFGYNYDDIIFVEYDGLTDFVEDDEVTVYGTISGEYSYTSQAGWEISVPGLLADEIE